mmetsp:Transcript_73264/g.214821  ORF Transcript_73264/g.214821 Transcript_73264/m.214821 type:complete len:184 (-) Transcript_73264:812-1363(-)
MLCSPHRCSFSAAGSFVGFVGCSWLLHDTCRRMPLPAGCRKLPCIPSLSATTCLVSQCDALTASAWQHLLTMLIGFNAHLVSPGHLTSIAHLIVMALLQVSMSTLSQPELQRSAKEKKTTLYAVQASQHHRVVVGIELISMIIHRLGSLTLALALTRSGSECHIDRFIWEHAMRQQNCSTTPL